MTGETKTTKRGQWGSRLGFILAASGSAVGLGNIWKFPYITGENGGGLFVLIYLACIALIGLPIMIAEIVIGRRAQKSPVGAFQTLAGNNSSWRLVGWLGVVAGFIILSYYSVVAGWAMNYGLMSVARVFEGKTPDQIETLFGVVQTSGGLNLFWHAIFMGVTVVIVAAGVQKGIESWARVLMPTLLLILVILLVTAIFQPGFGEAVAFVFKPNLEKMTQRGALEALGHSFFTLSLGMGALMTYGSYLRKDDDIIKSAGLISLLDTLVALMACMVLFPIVFSYGMEPSAGPGLVFKSLPMAFCKMQGGMIISIIFFVLLVFAALTSAISLLEVVGSTVIDQLGWSRRKAVVAMGIAIFVFGVPSAMSEVSPDYTFLGISFGEFTASWKSAFGMSFFDTFDYLASNWLLPLGGFFIAIYTGWFMPKDDLKEELCRGTTLGFIYPVWLAMIRFLVPVAVLLLFCYTVGIIKFQ